MDILHLSKPVNSRLFALTKVKSTLQSREECLIDSLGQIVHDGFSGLLFQFSHALPVEDQTRSLE